MDTTIKGFGINDNIEAQVDRSHGALRANLRPLEHTGADGSIGGHFYLAASFLSTAAALSAASQIFSVRWADSRYLFVLKRLTIQCGLSTAFGAVQVCDYDAIMARSFSANPSGGTSLAPASTAQKARTATMNGSLLANSGAIQISSGAALTAGTQTLDTFAFGYVMALNQTLTTGTAQTPNVSPLYELRDFGVHPIVLAANEGIVVRPVTGHGATGVVRHGITMEWAEVPAY